MRRDIENKYEWTQKGKSYKTKYFAALGMLLGDAPIDIGATASKSLKDERTKSVTPMVRVDI